MNEEIYLYKVTPYTFSPFYVAAKNQDDAVGKLYAYLSVVQPDGIEWHNTHKYNVQYIDHIVL